MLKSPLTSVLKERIEFHSPLYLINLETVAKSGDQNDVLVKDVLVETTLFAKLHQLNEKQESVLLPSVDSSYNNIVFFS